MQITHFGASIKPIAFGNNDKAGIPASLKAMEVLQPEQADAFKAQIKSVASDALNNWLAELKEEPMTFGVNGETGMYLTTAQNKSVLIQMELAGRS